MNLLKDILKYSDSELMNVYKNKSGYTEDARKALEIVIENKGGFNTLKERYNELIKKEEEKRRLHRSQSAL
jgi:primase-polymerase (primpol)-like protein